jgi:hypothetical protein
MGHELGVGEGSMSERRVLGPTCFVFLKLLVMVKVCF